MIRPARVEDIPAIVEKGKRLHAESSYMHVTYAPERAEALCKLLILAGFIVVAEIDGEIVGAMLGDVYTPWYTNDLVGIEYSLYIEPERRNGLIAVKMVRAWEKWCIAMGAKQLRPGVGTGDGNAGGLYLALGYTRVGDFFCKDI